MASFVAVPAQVLESYLQSLKFDRSTYGREVVYVRKSAYNPDVQIKVYTSIRVGQSQVRDAGRDAIRICVVFDNGRRSFGIGRFQPVMRVHSVRSVLDRLFERLQEAAKRAREWMAEEDRRNGVPRSEQEAFNQRQDDMAAKAAFARLEREQEEAAFMSDPDMRALAAEDADPCSEPPESGPVTFDQYADFSRATCPDGCC